MFPAWACARLVKYAPLPCDTQPYCFYSFFTSFQAFFVFQKFAFGRS